MNSQKLNLRPGCDGDLWRYSDQGRTHALHRHAELEFNLVTQGAGLYLLANRKYRIRRGDLLWLFPEQEHVLIEQTPDFEMWIGVCKPRAVRRIATEPDSKRLQERDPGGDYCRRLSRRALARLEALFDEVAAAHDLAGLFNAGMGYALLNAWRHFKQAAQVPVDDVHPAVERAARLLQDEPTLNLEELARRAGLSATRLGRLFKEQTGVALVEFRNRQRVESFLRIYGAGQRIKMVDAALEAGFGSYPQFHRVFRRVMGCSPGAYRQRRDMVEIRNPKAEIRKKSEI